MEQQVFLCNGHRLAPPRAIVAVPRGNDSSPPESVPRAINEMSVADSIIMDVL